VRKVVAAGSRFSRWVLLEPAIGASDHPLCRCECGTESRILMSSLSSQHSRSCGCLRRDTSSTVHTTHGKSKSIEYFAWREMIRRCYAESRKCYKYYGGRGITVCDQWRHSFPAFLEYVGPRPSPQHSIDRINTRAITSPETCGGQPWWSKDKTGARPSLFRWTGSLGT
jgi:hypothetical protein